MLADDYDSPVFLMAPNTLAWQFFEVVRFRQQVSGHISKAFG
jgi:hypothetical protein